MSVPPATACVVCATMGHFCQARERRETDHAFICFDCADGVDCFYVRKNRAEVVPPKPAELRGLEDFMPPPPVKHIMVSDVPVTEIIAATVVIPKTYADKIDEIAAATGTTVEPVIGQHVRFVPARQKNPKDHHKYYVCAGCGGNLSDYLHKKGETLCMPCQRLTRPATATSARIATPRNKGGAPRDEEKRALVKRALEDGLSIRGAANAAGCQTTLVKKVKREAKPMAAVFKVEPVPMVEPVRPVDSVRVDYPELLAKVESDVAAVEQQLMELANRHTNLVAVANSLKKMLEVMPNL